jgi:hypothetical protein
MVTEDLHRVDVLAVDRKTPRFYDRVLARLRDLRRDIERVVRRD